MRSPRRLAVGLLAAALLAAAVSHAAANSSEPALPEAQDAFVVGQGDVVRIAVFQSPDLTLETRVDGNGRISYPFLGQLTVAGLSPAQIERQLARELERRDILKQPQVSVNIVQFRSRQVAVLGHVHRPGKYPLELPYTVSDVLALAGGVTQNAADAVVLSRAVNGERINLEIDLARMFMPGSRGVDDPLVQPGDVLYAHRAPLFYIHGEVQRPGAFRLERDMTLQQALSAGGGITPRGTLRGVTITRRGADGRPETLRADLRTPLRADDVVTVPESWF
jgi:polysaccharide export outer membrane protein